MQFYFSFHKTIFFSFTIVLPNENIIIVLDGNFIEFIFIF